MSDLQVVMKPVFGHSVLREFHRFENGRMVGYGYRIDYDENGKEIGRTKPSAGCSIGWSDGSPFTEHDAISLSIRTLEE